MILSLFNPVLVPQILSPLLVHLYLPLWKLITALSVTLHLLSGINYLRNFAKSHYTKRFVRVIGMLSCAGLGLMIATSGFLTALECTKSIFGRGSAPDPAGGAYSAPPDPLAGFEGSYF